MQTPLLSQVIPRASNQAILAVAGRRCIDWCQGWRRSRRSRPEVLRRLNKAGNFVPVIGKSGTLAQGATPIIINWDYNALSPAATR